MDNSYSYSAYRDTGVKTASQGKLVVMLYDGMLRQLDAAAKCFDGSDTLAAASIETLNNHVIKTQEILTELMVSLNMDEGGEIARNLMSLYLYFNQELLNANISHNRAKILSIRSMIGQLRDSWDLASNTSGTALAPRTRVTVDING